MALSDRAALEARWLDLTSRVLPGLAHERGWPIRADHCFQRVILDAVFDDVWYRHVPQRPAYRTIDATLLLAAVTLAEAIGDGKADLTALNATSLAHRKVIKRKG